ncbi:MAG: (Fe-S)-binding protein [Myxococcaceae bacterium]
MSLNQHDQAYSYCAFCPKMCRFSCPVSEGAHSESLSAWGKMTAAHLVQDGKRRMDEGSAKAVHACTGCMRCTSFCKHENAVGDALFAARGEAIQAGLQPRGASSTLATFTQSQNPFGTELSSLVESWRNDLPVRFPLFPGCSTLVKRAQLIEDTLAVSRAFGAPMGVSRVAARCCGYPLYAGGSHDAFVEHATANAAVLDDVPELAVLDPGCAYTFKVVYPQFGVKLRTRVRTVIEILAEHLSHAPHRPPLEETVGYHDACHLGRGLGQYDEPRALLKRAVKNVTEAASVRREAGCAGGGGLLPRTMPDVAVEVARRQAIEVTASQPELPVATACPTSKRMFERAGRTSYDLMALLRRWVGESA